MKITVPKSEQLRSNWNDIVQKCVQLRKKYNVSVVELSKDLNVDRRKIHAL